MSAHDDHRSIAWDKLRRWLRTDEEGQALLAQLAADPALGTRILLERLQRSHLPGLSATVTGGEVGKLVQFANAEVVHIQQAKASPATFQQLPYDIPDFTNRTKELTTAKRLLRNDIKKRGFAPSILVVSGKPGVGKSAFAIRAAHQLRSRFPDAQLYANLRTAGGQKAEPGIVLAGFLRALGVDGHDIPTAQTEREGMYRGLLAGKRVLIVLDNAKVEAQVRPLLPTSGACSVLITSREPLLGIEGSTFLDLGVLDPESAAKLFTRVAAPRDFRVGEKVVRDIVDLCGYLPLAIRIAGARLRSRPEWSASRWISRLSDERHRLGELRVGDLEVRSSFSLSYDELDPAHARLFRLLGLLHASDFAPPVVSALAATPLHAAERILDVLTDAQLVESIGDGRYRFHDLLRLFARERLEVEEPEQERVAALQRTIEWYVAAAESASTLLPSFRLPNTDESIDAQQPKELPAEIGQRESMAWFEAEHPNLMAAIEQALDAELHELVWRLAVNLAGYFDIRAAWGDWQHTHRLALSALRQSPSAAGEAAILRGLGEAYRSQARWEAAVKYLEDALPLYREVNDNCGEAYTLIGLGDVYRCKANWLEAINCLDRCLVLFRAEHDRSGEAYTLRALGDLYRYQGRWDEATSYLNEALRLFQELGDRSGEARTQRGLAIVYSDQGRWDSAISSLNECIPIFRELRDRRWEARAVRSLGVVYTHQNRLDEAIHCLTQSLPVLQELDDKRWSASTLRSLGDAYCKQRRFEDATSCLERANSLFQEIGDRRLGARAIRSLGDVHCAQGRYQEAIDLFQQALPVLQEIGDRPWQGKTLKSLGTALLGQGLLEDAQGAWLAARSIFADIGSPEEYELQLLLEELTRSIRQLPQPQVGQ
jgi:tetratricopeptide (TPR) repeat protein